MLRASSSGLSIPSPIICLPRRGRTFAQDFSVSRRRKARWASNLSFILSDNTQVSRNKLRNGKERQNFQGPSDALQGRRHNEYQEKAECTLYATLQPNISRSVQISALSNLHQSEAGMFCPTSKLERQQIACAEVKEHVYVRNQALSHLSGKLAPAIRWQQNVSARKPRFSSERPNKCKTIGNLQDGGGVDTKMDRDELLQVLQSAGCASAAWKAYAALFNMIPGGCETSDEPFIPFAHLHRLCRVLSRNSPKTHFQFLRLLSVLNLIRSSGGRIHLHEWNALIDHAAQGWRRNRLEDWEAALGLYNDMIGGYRPGVTVEGKAQTSEGDNSHAVQPDIYTYNSLINAAVGIHQPHVVRHAMALLDTSGITPNRITFLILLKHYSKSGQVFGIRSTLLKMRERGFELGLDGINACLWAYGQNERPDVVMKIYRLLLHNLSPGQGAEMEDSMLTLKRQLEEEEYICVSDDVKPDDATFSVVVQVMAYHGDLLAMLSVFVDVLTLLPLQVGNLENPNLHTTTLMDTVFRAIFLGFSRNGIPPLKYGTPLPSRLRISNPPGRPHWSSENLEIIFDAYLTLPMEIRPSRSTLHWIMKAFDVTSAQSDDKLREVWAKLDAKLGARFGVNWVAPTNRLADWRRRLFPEQNEKDRDANIIHDRR